MELDYLLQNDLEMLRIANIMDYSLMLIVINFPNDNDSDYQTIMNVFGERMNLNRIFKSKTNKYIYCVGIIDYLQKYNFSKKLENISKKCWYCSEIKNVSCLDPIEYSKRMHVFTNENVFVSNYLN